MGKKNQIFGTTLTVKVQPYHKAGLELGVSVAMEQKIGLRIRNNPP